MSRNRPPRKAYRPGRIDSNPVDLALSRAAKLDGQQVPSLLQRLADDVQRFRLGQGSAPVWAALADALNVAEALAALGIASDHEDTFAKGQAALAAVHGRAWGATRSWTLRGPELQAIDDAIFVHGVQLQHCSQGELLEAVQRVERRTRQALAGNASSGVTVLQVGAQVQVQAEAGAAA